MAATTREHLIQTGLQLMLRSGYAGTGLQDILGAAGVPKGSFYHHFPSKEAFAIAVLEAFELPLERSVRIALEDRERPALARLERHFQWLRSRAAKVPPEQRACLLGLFAMEVSVLSPAIRAAVQAGFERWRARLVPLIEAAIAEGALAPATDAALAASLLLDAFEGALLRSRMEGSLDALDRFIAEAVPRLLPRVA